jgi:hypothetical protein
MAKEKKKVSLGRLKWIFQDDAQAELIANAMLGQSNLSIQHGLSFTDAEIGYALHKAKLLYNMKQSIRQGWRDGTNDVARQVKSDLIAVLKQEVQAILPRLIVHPRPQTTADIKDDATHRSKKSFYGRTDRSGIPPGSHGTGGNPAGPTGH